ncbi:MAG: hypothetical protein HDR88_14150 [Bacteroides sp.]|nr:hypothetical protein [Bacteroides sp.]
MKTIDIKLDLNEVVYDIQNKTYLTGKSRRDGDNHEQVANMQANDDDENANQVLRSVSMAFSNLKMKLGEYLDLNHSTANNELMDSDTELNLTLKMPSNFNNATVDTVAAAAHQYVVSRAIFDWFVITDKKDAEEYATLADQSLKIISEAVSKRSRPQRVVKPKA